MKYKDKRR